MESAATDSPAQESTQVTTRIADLTGNTDANILAACIADPWPIGKYRWKTRLADPSGEVTLSARGHKSKFEFKSNDIVAAFGVQVGAGRGSHVMGVWLVTNNTTKIVVNPEEDDAVRQLKAWHQSLISDRTTQRDKEGFTSLADLTGKDKVHVVAVCTREPWQVGRTMWKTLLRDPSGQVIAMKRHTDFGFKLHDIVVIYSGHVGDFKGEPELEVRFFTEIVVNPVSDEASKLKEWYQNQVSKVEDEAITQIADLKKNTTANVLAVCTSDPMERPNLGSKKRMWQATMRDASGYMNVMKDDSNFDFKLNDVVEARRVFVREFILGVEMVIDDNVVVKVNPDSEEAKKLKEWYQTQGIRECVKLTEEMDMKLVEAAQHQLRSNLHLRCSICNVWCSGHVAYQNHVTGRNHLNAVLAKRGASGDDNGTAVDEGPPLKKVRKPESENCIRCDVCDLTVAGDVNYEAHIKGARHMKKIQENELVSFISTLPHIEAKIGNTPGMEYRCKVCNAYLSSNKVVIINHMKGGKHVKAVAKMESGHPERTDKPPPKPLIECKVCNVFVNSQAVLEEHRNSPKHKAKEFTAEYKIGEDGVKMAEETTPK